MNIQEILNNPELLKGVDVKIENGKSIKTLLGKVFKMGDIGREEDFLVFRYGLSAIKIKAEKIIVSGKKPSKEELLLKSMEVFE